MKRQWRRFSWFQKLILGYLVFIGFLNGLLAGMSFDSIVDRLLTGLDDAFVILAIGYLLMWLYNKYIAPRINVTNKTLKKSWLVIQIIVVCLIAFWLILFFFGVKIFA